MAKQLNWLQVDRHVRQRGMTIFSPQDLRLLLGASEISMRFLLNRATKRGDVLKLRRELYTLPSQPPTWKSPTGFIIHLTCRSSMPWPITT